MADCYCTEIPQWEQKISELEEEREKICEQEIPLQNVEEKLRQMENHSRNMIRIVYGERLFSMIRSSCDELHDFKNYMLSKIDSKLDELCDELSDMREEDDEYHREEDEDDAVLVNMLDASNNG